ncbi:serine/threonine protein kinase [Ktedonosporobacter rubrisoli]|uniref:non-specific serine/threonine protein kinase n=1 Tax=Ktedonosporobacter rubrisoli TaxID=2509675 RepID=A0A4V0Z032_KTERU|nr:serine/threonine-protein kinase [Ktedonosporobacter rubrisoli]QBD81811.1 serine/threonine protein kinase [Ktedonosporobacter rubrisoli]
MYSQQQQISQLSPGTHLRRYIIQNKIGEGGYGAVYKARDSRKPGKYVAIKQINLANLSTQEMIEATDTYNREVSMLSQLQHPGLPHIYETFSDATHWYVVQDYIGGKTLEALLKKRGRLSLEQTLDIGLKLCEILDYLHQQKPPIIYRDLKPSNIIMKGKDELYLVDFGIARHYRKYQRKDTEPLGSPGYAAPEQYGKAQSTPRTDVYGLGATLQELFTGREPLEIKMHGLPAGYEIPVAFKTLLEQMLQSDPAQRPKIYKVKQELQKLKQILHSSKPATKHPAPRAHRRSRNSGADFLLWTYAGIVFTLIPAILTGRFPLLYLLVALSVSLAAGLLTYFIQRARYASTTQLMNVYRKPGRGQYLLEACVIGSLPLLLTHLGYDALNKALDKDLQLLIIWCGLSCFAWLLYKIVARKARKVVSR